MTKQKAKSNKALYLVLLFALASTLILLVPSFAATNPESVLKSADKQLAVNKEVKVMVDVSGGSKQLGTANTTITFDETKLQYLADKVTTPGSSNDFAIAVNTQLAAQGEIPIDSYASLSAATGPTDVMLAELTFKVLDATTDTVVDQTEVDLRDFTEIAPLNATKNALTFEKASGPVVPPVDPETPTPVEETPTPVEETPTPVEETPTPVEETPTPPPGPGTQTPAPNTPTPVPATPTPEVTPVTPVGGQLKPGGSQTALILTPGNEDLASGESVSLNVTLDPRGKTVGAASTTLSFDPEKLEVAGTNVNNSNELAGSINTQLVDQGLVVIDTYADSSSPGQKVVTQLGSVEFKAKNNATGTAVITQTEQDVRDFDIKTLTSDSSDSVINLDGTSSPATPTPVPATPTPVPPGPTFTGDPTPTPRPATPTVRVTAAPRANVDNVPPTAPRDIRGEILSNSNIALSWKASTDASGIKNYILQRKTGNGAYQQLKVVNGSTLSYTDKATLSETSYQYRVLSRDNKNNISTVADTVIARTPAPVQEEIVQVTPDVQVIIRPDNNVPAPAPQPVAVVTAQPFVAAPTPAPATPSPAPSNNSESPSPSPSPTPTPSPESDGRIDEVGTSSAGYTDVVITVKDDDLAKAQINYGTQRFDLDQQSKEINFGSTNEVELRIQELEPATEYFYQINGLDKDDNEINSDIQSFMTKGFDVAITVRDKNQEPVPDVPVVLGDSTVITDSNGQAVFNVAPDNYTASYEIDGETRTVPIAVDNNLDASGQSPGPQNLDIVVEDYDINGGGISGFIVPVLFILLLLGLLGAAAFWFMNRMNTPDDYYGGGSGGDGLYDSGTNVITPGPGSAGYGQPGAVSADPSQYPQAQPPEVAGGQQYGPQQPMQPGQYPPQAPGQPQPPAQPGYFDPNNPNNYPPAS